MTKHTLVYFLAAVAMVASSHVLAGAGQTAAGVTTTTGAIDPTAATPNVNSQSSSFVQENQAAQAGQTGTPVSSATGIATSRTGATGATQTGDASNSASGKPGDPNNPAGANAAQVSAPVIPAAPPPEYVSNIKKVNHDATATDVAVVDSATTGGTTGAKSGTLGSPTASTALADNIVGAPGAQRQNMASTPRAPRAADATKVNAADHVAQQQAAPASGSGSAPDSFAFYIGIVIAGVLLAFAASTFFRSDRGSVK